MEVWDERFIRSTAMPPSDREEAIFAALVEKPTRAERAAYLEGACAGDQKLRERIEALLAAHDKSGVLDSPPAAGTTAPPPLTEKPGTVIGPYKLLQQIGEGGMGVVYMAEQQEPVRRKVALKIIKPGMDSAQVIARFEAERQALAMMDHPNIARVLDAGTTETGRPYFVMELVHGVPITTFCDESKLTPRERLELFIPVCQAIQHAHQKGIIHRDVKPSNVLVTMYDDKPVPKVIDFGVAKAIEQRLTEKTMFTQYGALVGTFEYMSPEQAEMNAFGVDTRSDIYSLGVLLYELLTGTTPLERSRLRQAALDEVIRRIREEEPPRPSLRLSSSNELPKIAVMRKTDSARLSTLVRGEIDWIVMKCLEKDRSRRYDTANGVARDLERYLADEPVEASPPSSSYRLRKFARKYKRAIATAAAFVALLVTATVTSSFLAVWARSAEREAERQRNASDVAKLDAVRAKAEADQQRDEARLTAYSSGIQLAQRAWNENYVDRARELLEEIPREAAGRNLRGFEWYYLNRLCHSELLTLEGHEGRLIRGVAFSPDGTRLASACDDETARIWDTKTGKELFCVRGHVGPVTAVEFSPDGRLLASGGFDRTVRIWDGSTGKELLSLKGHPASVWSVAFSPDGRCLASGGDDGLIKVWDSATGKEVSSLKGHDKRVKSVSFSPDGQRLASGSDDQTVRTWDRSTGNCLQVLKVGDGSHGMHVAFSPDGQRMASGGWGNAVKIWEIDTGKELMSLKNPGNPSGLAFSPDAQRLATADTDKTVKIWDCATGELVFALKGHSSDVLSVAFSRDGERLASGSSDGAVKLWDITSDNEVFSSGITPGYCVRWRSEGVEPIPSESKYSMVQIWDKFSGAEVDFFKQHVHWATSLTSSPDGKRLASTSMDGTVGIWDCDNDTELLSLKGHSGPGTRTAFTQDGQRLASASMDRTIKIWDVKIGEPQLTLKGHTGPVYDVAFSPNSRCLASGSFDRTVRIWDSANGTELFALKGHTDMVNRVMFSPDGRLLASASYDKSVKIWELASRKELFTLKGHLDVIGSLAFSPDCRRLASGSGALKIWDLASGRELLSLKNTNDGLDGIMEFSPDGEHLGSVGESICIWDASITPELRRRRSVNLFVVNLFRKLGLRADVLERLKNMPSLSASRRREAIDAAQRCPENPLILDALAWQLVEKSDGAMSDYRKAVLFSEEACMLEPEKAMYRITLGAAYFRARNYSKALDTLDRANRIKLGEAQTIDAKGLAFLAMTHHQLGRVKEAHSELERLRERINDPRSAAGGKARRLLTEAESLLAAPGSPGGK